MDAKLLFEIIVAGASLAGGWFSMQTRLFISDLRTEIALARVKDLEARAAQREELMKWINGSFMRVPVVEAHLQKIGLQIQDVERRVQDVEDVAA